MIQRYLTVIAISSAAIANDCSGSSGDGISDPVLDSTYSVLHSESLNGGCPGHTVVKGDLFHLVGSSGSPSEGDEVDLIYVHDKRVYPFDGEVVEYSTGNGMTSEIAIMFDDYTDPNGPDVEKVLRVFGLRPQSASKQACKQALEDRAPDVFEEHQRDEVCDNDQAIYWRIATVEPPVQDAANRDEAAAGPAEMLCPPDDGQGTGSGTGF